MEEKEVIKEEAAAEIKAEEVKKKPKKKFRFNSRKKLKTRVLKKISHFARNGITYVDYKDTKTLNHFINRQGQIIPRAFNRLTTKEQRLVAQAIRRARQMCLMPYIIVEQNVL